MIRSPAQTHFIAVFLNEVLLSSKRVAPYMLMILFAANAVLWWSRPAVQFGWATNSDWYIVRNLLAFSFLLGLPIFNAVIMGDPVIRDFRAGIDPIIFSKPVTRAQYLFGKFFGSFFVLVCCQAVFPLTQLVLQAFPTSRMIVLPIRVLPYFKHFFFFLVITHLLLAALYFTVGTLTRNSKIVYGLAAAFYPFYITYGFLLLRPLPFRWRLILDPMLLGASLRGNGFLHTAEFLNQYVVRYTADMIANRLTMILVTTVCLAIVYFRFTIAERSENAVSYSTLNLSTAPEGIYYPQSLDESEKAEYTASASVAHVDLTELARANEGIRSIANKLIAASGVEFRLLLTERSLLVIMPLAVILSNLEVAFYDIPPDVTRSAAYATNTAKLLLLFLIGIAVFYTGEAMHRDREAKIEPLLWSTPASNSVLLVSKFVATLVLLLSLLVVVGLIAILIQLVRGHTPVDFSAYLMVYGVVLVPGLFFLAAAVVVLNTLLRNKYLAYVVIVGTAAGLFYLYSVGHNHWLYNPLLYQLWQYADLTNPTILASRLYWLALAALCLALADVFFERKSN